MYKSKDLQKIAKKSWQGPGGGAFTAAELGASGIFSPNQKQAALQVFSRGLQA